MKGQEESKHLRVQLPRKAIKKRAPVIDHRKGSRIGIDAPNALVVSKPKTDRDVELITSALNKHFIFTSLTQENRTQLINSMKHFTLASKEIVFEQDQPGNNYFVVASGKLEVLVNTHPVNTLEPGDSFGELALLHDSHRSATIKTLQKTTMWGLDRKTFRTAVQSLNAQNYQENKSFIESVPLFKVLTSHQKETLIGASSTMNFRAGEKIVKEGDSGDLFFFIKQGAVSCTQNKSEIRKMFKGDFFGEQALLYNSPRTATVTALEDSKLLSIGREDLARALGNHLQDIIYRNSQLMAMEKNNVLSKLNSAQKHKLLDVMHVRCFPSGEVLMPSGTKKDNLCIVLRGSLKQGDSEVAQVLDCLGDVTSEEVFEEDLITQGEVDVTFLSKEEFEKALGGSFTEVTANNEALELLKRVQLLRGLTQESFLALLQVLKIQEYSDKEVIVQQNNPGDSFFIVKKGKVEVVKDGVKLRSVTKHDYFGERSVLFNDFRSASVIANGDVTCWVLSKEDFLNILDESVRFQLIKRIELQDDSIALEDLCIVKTLGKGMFGNVFMCVHKEKGQLYALKTVDRRKIERYEIQENLVQERRIMLELDHVFIVKLIRTFKDEKRIYLLMELVRGMDLFDVLRQLGLVTEQDSRFYTACLLVMLEHLHERDIIYRDLKPENVMVDEEGYPKLIDFGTAKRVQGRTYTIVGTPNYMAPEVILGKGYNYLSDYYTVGVMLYEFLCGGVPFGEDEDEPYAIYQRVLEHRLVYPSFVSPNLSAKPLIEQLLSKNPSMRLGGDLQNLKKHPWFGDFDWDKLLSRQLNTPYKPKVSNVSREVSAVLKNFEHIGNLITWEEAQESIPQSRKRRPKNFIPEDWDAEF